MKQNIQRLAEQHAADPSASRRDAVVRAAIPFIRSIISRITVPDHLLASQEDLRSVGLLGLLQALDSYDPERPTPFASYAYSRVRGAVLDYLRSIDVLPRTRRCRFAQAQQVVLILQHQNPSRVLHPGPPLHHELLDRPFVESLPHSTSSTSCWHSRLNDFTPKREFQRPDDAHIV